MKRRDFLRLLSLGGLVLGVPLIRLLPSEFPSSRMLQKSVYSMGTTVTISVEDTYDSNDLDTAVQNAFAGITRMEGTLTHFDPNSQLSLLNKNGVLYDPSPELLEAVQESLKLSETTEGTFDVTVQPALDLFTRFLSGGPDPTDADFAAAQKLIDFEKLTADQGGLTFATPGMGATLDGIAPGYILDKTAASLKSSGVKSALVQAGGTIVAIGARSDGSPWRIGVEDPMNGKATIGTLLLRDQAVATTGDYENYFTPDKRYYHVVDPSTARSPLYSHSATVVAPTCTVADSMGVVLMVQPPAEGLHTLDGVAGAECLIYTDSGTIVRSAGLVED